MLSLKSCYAASRSSNLQVKKNKYRKSYSRWNSFGCNCQKVYKLHSLLWTPYLQITCSITYAGVHFFLFTYVLSNVLANLNEEREMQYECYNSHTKYKETKNSEITSSWDDQVVSVQTKGCWRVTFVSPDFFFTHDLKNVTGARCHVYLKIFWMFTGNHDFLAVCYIVCPWTRSFLHWFFAKSCLRTSPFFLHCWSFGTVYRHISPLSSYHKRYK